MAVGRWPFALSRYLSLLFLLSTIISSLHVYRVSNPTAAFLVAFNGDRYYVPDRNHCSSRHYSAGPSIPPCWKARAGLKLVRLSLCAGYLVLLSGDVSLNPGPVNGLNDVVKLRGLKFIHQNVQSLGDKIDQLRLLLQELHSGIQIITLSETWIKPDRNDSEYELPGYRLFRKDRNGNHGGVAVFVHDALVVTRRDDLALDTVEGMWLEIAVPKSRSFLVGNFYKPDRTSSCYDKDFMVKLNGILDTTSAEGKEMLLFGDFNCCFMSSHRNDSDC